MTHQQSNTPASSGALRLFVAIHLPEEVKIAIAATQQELRKLLPPQSASWTRPENMHLTMRFLGNVDAVRLDELQQRLRIAIAEFGALDFEYFTSNRRSRGDGCERKTAKAREDLRRDLVEE